VLKAHDIRYIFINGSSDSYKTAIQMQVLKEQFNYDIIISLIPKTVNNDIVETDFTPGFGSAAK